MERKPKTFRGFVRDLTAREMKNIGRAPAPIRTKLSPKNTRRVLLWAAIRTIKELKIETPDTLRAAKELARYSAEYARTGDVNCITVARDCIGQIAETEQAMKKTNEFHNLYNRYNAAVIKLVQKGVAKKAEQN